jgi:hypothetical protein
MPRTAATASGTAAGSVTAAGSKTQNTVRELIDQLCRDFHREAGLADPAYPCQGHQTMGPNRRCDLTDFGFAPDQTGRRKPQISRRRIERPQRGKVQTSCLSLLT